jgi:hypothetical protein
MAMQARLVATVAQVHLQRGQSMAVQRRKVRILKQGECLVHGILDGEKPRSRALGVAVKIKRLRPECWPSPALLCVVDLFHDKAMLRCLPTRGDGEQLAFCNRRQASKK